MTDSETELSTHLSSLSPCHLPDSRGAHSRDRENILSIELIKNVLYCNTVDIVFFYVLYVFNVSIGAVLGG